MIIFFKFYKKLSFFIFIEFNFFKVLEKHLLVGTGTTSKKVAKETGLDVEVLQSGPFGGDQQIGAKISEQTIDILIFFWDPLASMAHDQDVKALFRYYVVFSLHST